MSGTGRSQWPGQLTVGCVAAIGAQAAWDVQRPPSASSRCVAWSPGRFTFSCAALISGSTGGLT